MTLSNISMTSGMRGTLLSLQTISNELGRTQMRLSTGKKVNSALDNSTDFFAAQNHLNQASDLNARMNGISEAIQTIGAANNGITAISSLLNTAKGIASAAQGTNDQSSRSAYALQFDEILSQIDTISHDSSYSGTNLLGSQSLTVEFAAKSGQSTLTIAGVDASSSGLGVTNIGSSSSAAITNIINNITLGGSDPVVINGDGTVTDTNGPPPSGLSGVASVSSGNGFTLALKNDGTVVGWGDNSTGETTIPSGLTDVTAVSAGSGSGQGFGLALKSDGTVVGWGDDTHGQTKIPFGLTNVTAISAGYGFALALKSDGTVVGWGDNSFGQTSIPSGLTNVTAISAGNDFGVALKSDGTVVAWGDTTDYNLGSDVSKLSGITAISAGVNYGLALQANGTVAGFGDDSLGQASGGSALTGITAISAGVFNSLALDKSGTAIGWGAHVDPSLPLSGAKTTGTPISTITNAWSASGGIETSLDQLDGAINKIRAISNSYSSNDNILTTRQDFTNNMINILQTGSDNLTLADMNEEGANMLMLQTRQSLSMTSLSLGSQAAQAVLRLF